MHIEHFFAIWIIMVEGSDTLFKFSVELIRLVFFFIIYISSVYTCLQFALDHASKGLFVVVLSAFGIFGCSIYMVSKIVSIISFVKKIFRVVKEKLYGTSSSVNTKLKVLIENITAVLVSIGGLTVALKVIMESLVQVFDYIK